MVIKFKKLDYSYSNQRGFTFIELSIVLVIVGILIAAVMTADGLVRSAEIKSVITEVQEFFFAMRTFKMRYGSLPGDIRDASRRWPQCTDDGGNICDGNEDGSIGPIGVTEEGLRAWEHMLYAGFIDGGYTGIFTGPGGDEVEIKTNIPGSRLVGGGYTMDYGQFGNKRQNYIHFGSVDPLAADKERAEGSILVPIEAWNIDHKMDDSTANKGGIRAFEGTDALAAPDNCIDPGGDYNHDTEEIACSMAFRFNPE